MSEAPPSLPHVDRNNPTLDNLLSYSGIPAITRPTPFVSDIDRRRAQRDADSRRPGLIEGAGLAAASEWIVPWMMRSAASGGYGLDPDFELDDGLFKELTEGVNDNLWPMLDNAISLPHARKIRQDMLEIQETRQRLESMGMTGVALRMGALILDPAAIAISLGAAYIGGPAVYGANLTRAQRLIRGGLLASGSEAIIEGALTYHDPERDANDVIIAAVGGGVLGGSLNAWAGHRLLKEADRIKRHAEFDNLVRIASHNWPDDPRPVQQLVSDELLTDQGRLYFRRQLEPENQAELIEHLITRSGLDPVEDADMIQALREMTPEEAASFFGTARRADVINTVTGRPEGVQSGPGVNEFGTMRKSNLQAGDLDLSQTTDAKASMRWLRFSYSSILGGNKSPLARRTASSMADDALLKADGSSAGESASTWVTRQMNIYRTRYLREYNRAYDAWAKEHNIPVTKRFSAQDEFNREVTNAVRRPRGQYTQDPHVNRMADNIRDMNRELLGLAQRHGVKGFEEVLPNDTYLPRLLRADKMNAAIDRHGMAQVESFFTNAFVRGSDSLTPDNARIIARGYIRTVLKLDDQHSSLQKARMFSGDSAADELAEVLRDTVPGITESQIQDILYATRTVDPTGNIPPRARRRIRMDENYDDGSGLSLADMTEDNASTIFMTYSRQMIGASAAAEVYRAARTSADDVIENFSQLRNRLARDMGESGVAPKTIEKHLAHFQALDKHIRGIPLNPDTTSGRVLRILRAYNFMNVGGQFGWAQIPDFGNVVAEMGFKAMLQQSPAFRRVLSRARTGKMTNELLEEVETLMGIGTEPFGSQVIRRFNMSDGGMMEHTLSGLEELGRRGSHAAGYVSLMHPINMTLQRFSAATAMQKLTNMAFDGVRSGNMTKSMARRMASIGLDNPDLQQRIFNEIRQHARVEQGLLGKNLRKINLDGWDDQEAASKFIAAIDRWSRRTIQVPDIGNLHPLMTTELGKVLTQFRTFTLAAWEKQLLHKVQMHDVQAFSAAMWSMLFAGLAYTSQTYLLSIGRDDRDEYLERMLSDEAIAKAAFQRSPWSTFIPPATDTIWGATGGTPVFDARNTGLSTDVIFGNPTTSLLQNALYQTPRSIGLAVRGEEEFTQSDARAVARMLPFQRSYGVHNVLNALIGTFPED